MRRGGDAEGSIGYWKTPRFMIDQLSSHFEGRVAASLFLAKLVPSLLGQRLVDRHPGEKVLNIEGIGRSKRSQPVRLGHQDRSILGRIKRRSRRLDVRNPPARVGAVQLRNRLTQALLAPFPL